MSLIRDMKFAYALNPIVGSPTKLGLLRTLFGSPGRRWTGRELARAARISVSQAARDLRELADTSVVGREVVGRSYSWRLNESHVLWTALAELYRRESGVRAELLREIAQGLRSAKVERARVFGSLVRGEERSDSDVDLFVQVRSANERSGAEEAVDRIRARLWDRFGSPVSALIYTRADVARPPNPLLLRAIEDEGLDVLGNF